MHPFTIQRSIKNFGLAYSYWTLTNNYGLKGRRAAYLILIALLTK